MKILFVGNFSTPWSTHHPMVRELRKMNHQVVKFDFRGIAAKSIRIKAPFYTETFYLYFDSLIRPRLYLPDLIRSIKYHIFGNYKMNKQLLDVVKKKDFNKFLETFKKQL